MLELNLFLSLIVPLYWQDAVVSAPGAAHVAPHAPTNIGIMEVSDPAKAALSTLRMGPLKGKEREGDFPGFHSDMVESSTAIVVSTIFLVVFGRSG